MVYNVSCRQVRSWILKYIEGGEAALEDCHGQRKKDQHHPDGIGTGAG